MARTKEQLREYQRLYKRRPEVRAKQQEYQKEYRQRPGMRDIRRGYVQKWHLKQRGFSQEEYELLFAAQRGLCAICNQPETTLDQGHLIRLAIDHHHKTGRIRGLLCGKCNRGIGLLRDDAAIMRSAAAYIEREDN